MSPDDLIVAAATPPGGAVRAIVRIAGEGLPELLRRLLEPAGPTAAAASEWPPREATPRLLAACFAEARLVDRFGKLPCDVLLWSEGGPIGGPLAELQLPGCDAMTEAVVAAACRHGCRVPRGGEFTLRAFLAGRLDLLAAEAVLAVVDARSHDELSTALDRMAGGTGRSLEAVRQGLLEVAGDLEAMIDFGEEAIPPQGLASLTRELRARLGEADEALAAIAARLDSRSTAAAGLPRVVIAGPANIGKSSLFNALLAADAALVADEPGTTRDWVEAEVASPAGRYVLVDLAGIEADPARQAAVDASLAEVARADVVVACRDAAERAAGTPPASPADRPVIPVITRCDLVAGCVDGGIATSARDGAGLAGLREAIERATLEVRRAGTPASARLAAGIDEARGAIASAASMLDAAGAASWDEAIVAAEVGRGLAAVDAVTGRQLGTDLLEAIFSRHCIGK